MKKKIYLAMLCLLISIQNILGQASVTPNTWNTSSDYLGWDATALSPPLNIRTTNNDPINFYTNFGSFTSSRMTILGGNSTTGGYVGIGYALTPGWQLDVNSEINITNPTFAGGIGSYMLGGNTILTSFGTNLIAGIGAGINNAAGNDNTFVGTNAGQSNILTSGNTFVGYESGLGHLTNGGNTFLGWWAGRDGENQAENVFIGTRAGQANDENFNVMIGVSSGQTGSTGRGNVFVGHSTGFANTVDNNVFIGNLAGFSNTGETPNTYLGTQSGENATGGRNNTFIGFRAGHQSARGDNTFVGHQSGQSNNAGSRNAFLGTGSGSTNADGADNTFLGFNTGFSNTDGIKNAFDGSEAGFNNLRGNENVFNGYHAGFNNKNASENTFVGTEAGLNSDKNANTFIGYKSGRAHNDGTSNVYVGHSAGATPAIGNNNTLIGYNTTHANNITNSTAIGNAADVQTSNSMILGNNNINVGIGLSGAATGPQTKLEINTGSTSLSGLRFRTYTNASSSITNTTNKVLSLNNTGDVILVDDVGGGSLNTSCLNADILPRSDGSSNNLACSDIYNNASSATNRIGFFTTTPFYKFQMHGGTSVFSAPAIGSAFTIAGNGTPAVMINSDNNEALTILHSGINDKDRMKVFGDNNRLYHIQTLGGSYSSSGPHPSSITFDNTITNSNGTTTTSWMGFNSYRGTTVVKNNFNTTPDAPSTAGAFPNLTYAGNDTKMYVEAQTPSAGTYTNQQIYGMVVNNSNTANTNYTSGLLAYNSAARTGTVSNRAGMFWVTGATGTRSYNIGVQAVARSATSNANNIAGSFLATGGMTNYGVVATSPITTCVSGNCSNAAGFFNGYAYSTKQFVASDTLLKQNMVAVGTNTFLDSIKIYSFTYDTTNSYGMHLPGGTQYGVKAHELQALLPSLVKSFNNVPEVDSSGNPIDSSLTFKAVDYTGLVPLLIKGYQQQSNKIDTLNARIDSLITVVGNCCNANTKGVNTTEPGMSIELKNTNAIILNQNEPNPFAENTTITWNIPEQELKGVPLNAMLVFYDNNGSVLKTVKINETGDGSLLVYGNKLMSGIYTYSLVVNGKTISTKKMVRAK